VTLLAEDPELWDTVFSESAVRADFIGCLAWQRLSLLQARKRGPLTSRPVGAMSTKSCWMWRGWKVREGAS
jgi:hypothetical protein